MSEAPENLLTATQAAQVAGVSRWAIHRAIRSKLLKAVRDNRNIWRISRDALAVWRSSVEPPQLRAQPPAHSPAQPGGPDARALVEAEARRAEAEARAAAAVAGELAAIRARDQAEADRDHWRAMAESLAARRRWWPFG